MKISAARFAGMMGMAVLLLPLLSVSARGDGKEVHREVLVFIPAYEGSQLYDPTLGDGGAADPICVWGNAKVFFSRTLYFALRLPNPLMAKPLLGVGPLDVYRHFIKTMTTAQKNAPRFAPYTEGVDFYTFSYDWRKGLATVTAPELARAMEGYARTHAEKTGIPASETRFVLVTHSMGGLVARTWLSENPAWAGRLAGLYMVASPNRGSVKAVRTVVYGPDSLQSGAHGFPGALLNLVPTAVDQNVTKLTGITRPSLYELLPMDDPGWVDEADGKRRKIGADQLLEAATWEPYWPSAALEKRLYLDDWLKKRQAEGRKMIRPLDWEFCQDPAFGKLEALLRETASWRAVMGSLQHTATLLTQPGEATRLHMVVSTGLKTPSGVVTQERHDATEADYTYAKGDDGDGTVEEASALDGFAASAPNVRELHGVSHGKLMGDAGFLAYFVGEMTGGEMVPGR